jgi:hypothetical protein
MKLKEIIKDDEVDIINLADFIVNELDIDITEADVENERIFDVTKNMFLHPEYDYSKLVDYTRILYSNNELSNSIEKDFPNAEWDEIKTVDIFNEYENDKFSKLSEEDIDLLMETVDKVLEYEADEFIAQLLGCTEEKWQEQERMANLEKEIDTNWGFCKESHNDNYDDVPDEY